MPPSSSPTLSLANGWEPLSASSPLQLPSSAAVTRQHTATIVAQFDQDVLGDISGAFKNFVDSGQIWALVIGIVIGYVIRGITTYK
ncbi:MAG: hypothetical protein F6J95_010010 [Leptolyngbya sp. SIO1E4]|nr:hypothetical protein [Leptolyngbya sp. SIO1E4]